MHNIFLRIKNNKFIANTGWMVGERVFQMVISLVVGMLTARYLGPSNYGVINYVAAYIAFATPVCLLGFNEVLVKKIIDSPNDEGKIIGTAILFEFFSALLSSIIIIVIVFFSNAGEEVKVIVAALESIKLLFNSTEAIEFWFQSKLQSKHTSIAKIIGYITMSLYRVFCLITQRSVVWFAFATSLDMIVIGFLYFFLYKKYDGQKLRFNFVLGISILKESYHFIISGLMVVVYSQMDKIMIQSMLGDTDVGLYSAAYTVCNMWFFIPTAIIASAKPLIMRAKQKNEDEYLLRLKQLYAGVFWLGIFVGLVISFFSTFIIRILYGENYIKAAGALIIGIWYGTFAQLGSARVVWLLCEKKNKYNKYFLFWGVIVNLVLNFTLIPMWGINGAAIATLVTQITTSVIAPCIYKETRIHTKILFQGISLRWVHKKA